MSLVPSTAIRIANMVVRYASAGSKEWAQAICNELTSIESDWQALAWALGALRVLFTIQPAPLRTVADLDSEIQKYADRRRHAVNNGWLITNLQLMPPLGWSLINVLQIATGRHILSNSVQLLGWLLTLPMIYLRTREPNVPDRDDQTGLLRFYVNELSARSRNSLSFWMFLAGNLFLTFGVELMAGRGWSPMIPLIAPLVLTWFLIAHVKTRRRFAQVKALLGSDSIE